MNETRYNIYPKVQYGTEHRRACPRNRSVVALVGGRSTDHVYVPAHVIKVSKH